MAFEPARNGAVFTSSRHRSPPRPGSTQALTHAVQHAAVLLISRRRPDPLLHRAAFLAKIYSFSRQLLLLHELHSEVHSAAALAHGNRLHGGALDCADRIAALAQSRAGS